MQGHYQGQKNGDNLFLLIVGKTEKSINDITNKLKSSGYDVHIRLVDLPADKAASRAVKRYMKGETKKDGMEWN
jgi:hypothetical protein